MGIETILIGIGCLTVGLGAGVYVRKMLGGRKLADAESRAKILFEEAESKAKAIRKEAELEAKDAQLKARASVEKEIAEVATEMGLVEAEDEDLEAPSTNEE